MCQKSSPGPVAPDFKHVPETRVAATPRTGSRRTRLWELPASSHCPVVGVCLPLPSLRRLVERVVRDGAPRDDYELHARVVAECASRSRVSEKLHEELERRHAAAICALRDVRTTEALAAGWGRAVAAGDIAAQLWAVLTHPRCDAALLEKTCRDVHMIQHQAGAALRVDGERLRSLQDENTTLKAEAVRLRERHATLVSERDAELCALRSELMQARTATMVRDSRLQLLRAEADYLKGLMPDLEARLRLTSLVDSLREQLRVRDEQLQAIQRHRERLAVPEPATVDSAADAPSPRVAPPPTLADRTVLCVGGRSGSIPVYRGVIEQLGGRYLHHDGGLEDNVARLEACVAAADLVICQTGCVSHNAYWRVKDQCKRTGKRCVFVENPGAAALERRLVDVLGEEQPVMVR